MTTDHDLETRVRRLLRETLDRETAPHPTWAESPAARRVEQVARRRVRWPLRVLAIAALMTIGVGSALLFGAQDQPSGGNGWIAQSSGGDIYLLAPGQEVRRVIGTDGDGVSVGCPAFSPDGGQLAYGRVAGEVTTVLNAEGSEVDGPVTYQDATLVVADVADDRTVTDSFTVDIGDGLPPPCPVWSPTGDRIAFAVPLTSTGNPTQSAAGSEVWILTLADRGVTVLPDLLATDLEFSPDGSLLGIASGTDAPPVYGEGLPDGRIYLYDLASGAMRILDGTLGVGSFTWSPDGGRIAYQTGDSSHDLRLIDLATEEQRELSTHFAALHGIGPVWSPDGESIVYQRGYAGSERTQVVLVWPDDLAADGIPREEVVPLFDRSADGSERELWPYWITWSPDGQYLLFSAWPTGGRSLLGVVASVPRSPSDILVDDGYPNEDPQDVARVFWEPFLPIQTWQRRPAGAVMPTPTPTPEVSPAQTSPTPFASPSAWTGIPHVLLEGTEGTDSAVPITVTIPFSGWHGEPTSGILCWRDPVDACAGPPDGAGIFAFEGRQYSVYGEACQWSTTRPDTPATTVDELIDALANQGSRAEGSLGPPEAITVDGYAGTRIFLPMHPVDINACDEGVIAMFGLPGNDPARSTQSQDLIEEVWAIDVDGLIVVLDGTYYPETPQDVVDELRAIVASATFE